MNGRTILSWILRGFAALILVQSLFFKFSAAPESVELFSKLGMEPLGRIGVGVAELLVSILLLLPRTAWLGALGGLGVMAGAIGAHLTIIGIESQGDGGLLFYLAVAVFLACAIVLYLHRAQLQLFLRERKR